MADGAGRFAGRVVVITGAASGIGRALARAFAAEGAHVAGLDLDAEGLEGTRAAIGGVDRFSGAVVDVCDEAACRAAIEELIARRGGIDVLVNNAGLSHHGTVAETRPEVLERVMAVNFGGAVHCTHAALGSLLERRGSVVAISSVAGFAPLVERAGYAASKHALEGFFESLRCEIEGSGAHVLIACPGYTATAIDAHSLTADGASGGGLGKRVVGRMAAPEQVAAAIVDATARRRRRLLIGPVGKAAWVISRLAPRLYARLMLATHRH